MANNRKTYDFASVGELNTVFGNRLVEKSAGFPVGIKTPMELGYDNSGPFKMRSSLPEQIRDNFRNMLQTNHGDRVMLTDFGANLEELAFELCTEDGDTQAIGRIKATTSKYMPFINLMTFEPIKKTNDDGGLASVGFRVIFNVPTISTEEYGVEVIIYSAG